MLGLAELGLYGIGFRIASVVTLVMQAFQGAMTPLVYARYKEERTPAEIARIFRFFVFLALIAFVALSIFSKEVLILLTTPAYYSAYVLVPFLVADQFLSGMGVFAPGLGIAKKTKYMATINIFGALFSVAFSVALIYYFGLLGAAVAAFCKSFAMFLIQMRFSQKFYRVPHNYGQILLSFLACALLVSLASFVDRTFPFQASVLLKSLIFISCIPILTWIGLVRRSEIIYYLSKLGYR